ncbi:cytosolic non-specific dipeptidase-like isoform X2 [Eublepharis macularius]|uniref:Cytosolic non-specific dipeptidase-like isoform X2 n=1 Tax=Eublepharis macularius TaxID=481883 RepID=A0AA97JNP6_EUBMA|nr:cytosolic non-specific dipeptidase-like isoform X2 [Eublepharis macularius]
MPDEGDPRAPRLRVGMPRLAPLLGLCLWLQLPFPGSGARLDFRVLEEQPAGTWVGSFPADFVFPDSNALYRLETGAPHLRVDGKTGEIYTATRLDRESLPECRLLFPWEPCYLDLEVLFVDLLSNSPRLLQGRVEVLDVNDNSPRFESPVFTLAVPENSGVGTIFPLPPATDADTGTNGVASYQLLPGSDARHLFGLRVAEDQDEKQPQLIVMGNLDRKEAESYNLTFRAQDGGHPPRAGSALLHVRILDVNDNAPAFEKPLYEAELLKSSPVGRSVLQVKAEDSDEGANAEIDYFFHSASPAVRRLLQLDRTTGRITVRAPVDREDVKVLKFIVLARDRGVSPQTAHARVVISIRDIMNGTPTTESHDKIFQYIDEHQNEYVQRLKDWVAIESDSSDPLKRHLLINMVHLAEERIKQLGGTVELAGLGVQELPNGNTIPLPPVILANIGNDPKKPTVCFYGHLDVQPAKLEDGWSTEPYILTERNGRLYGRGTSDDKGQILAVLNAVEALQRHELPVNVKFLLESMEEVGSTGLFELVEQRNSTFFSDVNYIIVTDTSWISNKPGITYGTRGNCYFFVEVECAKQDLHSGSFGGIIHEATNDLIFLLSTLVNSSGHILIPGIYEAVAPLTEKEKELYERTEFNFQKIKAKFGIKNFTYNTKQEILMHRSRYPSLSIHGIEGAFSASGTKTVIPARVIGKFSLRLVPNMEPTVVIKQVTDYLKKKFAEWNSPNHLEVTSVIGAKPWISDTDEPLYLAGRKAIKKVFQVEADLIRAGGTIPIGSHFQEVTGKKIMFLGIGGPDDAPHGQNEKINRSNFIEGTKLYAALLQELASF